MVEPVAGSKSAKRKVPVIVSARTTPLSRQLRKQINDSRLVNRAKAADRVADRRWVAGSSLAVSGVGARVAMPQTTERVNSTAAERIGLGRTACGL